MVSALLLGLISIATFTGLQAVSASDANQRYHNEAAQLAAQSQEALRTDPIGSLEKLVIESHVYTTKVDGTTYSITQSAHQINGSGLNTTCAATEQSTTAAPNFRITTSVIWNSVQGGHPVTSSSIVTPPTGSSLEVDVQNAPTPTAGVAGVTVYVTYTALESASTVKLEGTTSNAGCVLFTGIRSTSAEVEIPETAKFVTPSGALKLEPTEVSIAPNVTTHYAVTYNEGGAITAKFTYKGKTEYNGKPVTSDTFVMANNEMALAPELEVGSTVFAEPYGTDGEEKYTPKTSTYRSTAGTPKGAKYSAGDLFPFPSASWSAYAGDCAANNPLTVTSKAVTPNEGEVRPGATTTIEVPMSYVNLEVYKGTEKNPSALASAVYPIKITNLSCSAASPAPALPDNAAAVSYVHMQSTTAGGVLEGPFQPFGKFELCLQAASTPSTRRDKISYLNSTVAGSSFKIYPEEPTAAETKAAREKEEAPAREKREKEEAAQKKSREAEIVTNSEREKEEAAEKKLKEEEPGIKTKFEAEEKTSKEAWKREEEARKISKSQRETKEKELKLKNEATQKATKENREREEKEDKEQKTSEEAAKAARVSEEAKTKETKTKESEKQTARIKEEEKEATEKAERIAKGTAAAVESGSC
ncbi:MAG TPA: hypothetical protein VIH71_10730 [Solirubrobacteraceae bacterium]